MTRYLSRAALVCSLFALVGACGVAFDGVGLAAGPPSRYPLDLDVAIGKAYAGKLTGIQRSCTVWLDNGRDEYALAAVTLRGGRQDLAGFQFINTAGWFTMWRNHAPTPAVPTTQRTTVARLVRQVAARCSTRWTVTAK
jgi:hypothetical protein